MAQEKTTNGIISWLQGNLWAIFMAAISVIISLTLMSGQGKANAQEIENLKIVVTEQGKLIERIIVLEEHDKSYGTDISEMKNGINDLREMKTDIGIIKSILKAQGGEIF